MYILLLPNTRPRTPTKYCSSTKKQIDTCVRHTPNFLTVSYLYLKNKALGLFQKSWYEYKGEVVMTVVRNC